MIPGFHTIEDLQRRTGIPASTLRWHCRQGMLACGAVDTGRIWLIPNKAADDFCREYVRRGRLA